MSHINNFYLFSEETSKNIGLAMEVHKTLGKGFSEIVYKDAMEHEMKMSSIEYTREKPFSVKYKDIVLAHKFFADFIVFDSVIIEVKAKKAIAEVHYAQTINYLAASKCKVGLILNFGESSLIYKRVILD